MVLIEILDTLFGELEKYPVGWFGKWFGKQKRSRKLIKKIRAELRNLRTRADLREESVKESTASEKSRVIKGQGGITDFQAGGEFGGKSRSEIERTYRVLDNKVRELDMKLPELKSQIREYFNLSTSVKSVFIQIDDFYHLSRADQPLSSASNDTSSSAKLLTPTAARSANDSMLREPYDLSLINADPRYYRRVDALRLYQMAPIPAGQKRHEELRILGEAYRLALPQSWLEQLLVVLAKPHYKVRAIDSAANWS
jgi:hypothetical protein